MIPITTFAKKTVAVFGLGSSGAASALALIKGGANVLVSDDNLENCKSLERQGVSIVDFKNEDLKNCSALVLSPGVPLTNPEPHWIVKKAILAGIEIIGDVELFCRERKKVCPQSSFIAITGTNGKSTTTALIAHILKETGRNVQLGGNIGRAILTLDPFQPNSFYVVECSSFQIDLAPSINPNVGILLNVTPDHLDRHGTMEKYAAIKEFVVSKADASVVVVDDKWTSAIANRCATKSKKLKTVSTVSSADVSFSDSKIFYDGKVVANVANVRSLRGRHNGENACAAYAALHLVGLKDEEIVPNLNSYPGLAHRMEEVGQYKNIFFINDSKATNAESTEKALSSWAKGIFIILGGKPKEGGIESLRTYFPRIKKAYLIGVATEEFAKTLGKEVVHEKCGTMDVAVRKATSDALSSQIEEGIILLSPACASFDQYKNFEERGEHFRKLVALEMDQRKLK